MDVSVDEVRLRRCANCGGDLDDVEWCFDPCSEDEDGNHREAEGGRVAASWRVTKAVWGVARSHSPRWLLPVLAVCLAIPGPLDELLVVAVVLVPVLRSREARAELGGAVRGAWRGRHPE
jgi:hypothetical protein